MKSELIHAGLGKLALALATAAGIAGGSAILKNERVDAVQETRIMSLEDDRELMEELSEKLDTTNQNVAVLNERLENIRVPRD